MTYGGGKFFIWKKIPEFEAFCLSLFENINMIKSYFSVLCALFLISHSLLAGNGFIEIHNEKEWKSALESARAQNKLVLLDFYTGWCGYCKKMDRDVFSKQDFQKELKKQYVTAKLDGDSPFGKSFAQQNGVQGYPTYVFFDGAGTSVGKVEGYLPLSEFRSTIQKIHLAATKGKAMAQRFADKDLSNAELAEFYTLTKDAKIRNQIYKQLMATITDEELLDGNYGGFLKASSTTLDRRSTKVMLHNKKAFIEAYGEENYTGAVAQLFNNTLLMAIETGNTEILGRMEKELLPYFIDDAEQLPEAVLVTHKIFHSGRSDWDNYQLLIENEWKTNPQENQVYQEVYQLLEEFSHDAEALNLASNWLTPEAKAMPSFDNYFLLAIVEAVRENKDLAMQHIASAEKLAMTEEERYKIQDIKSQLEEARE